jgi:hypothetical protein
MPGFGGMDMGFPKMNFPKFPKMTAADFAGGSASMQTSEFHCVNGVCDGKSVKGKWKMPMHSLNKTK